MEHTANSEMQGKKKKKSSLKSIILGSILGVVIIALIIGGYWIYNIVNRPHVLFEQTEQKTATPTAEPTPILPQEIVLTEEEHPVETVAPATPVVTPTPAPADEPTPAPDPRLKGIVNIALFGLDAKDDGGTTSGSMVHADVNLVVAINFDTDEVSLISIARDVLTTAPGHSGFYKLGGIFNVGGGMDDPEAGFDLASRSLEEWLGGMSIPYYYGLDYRGVIDLVDAIGGVDYDLDIDLFNFAAHRIETKGWRHLNGEKVLAYLRMRKTAGGLDYLRTERQRRMMVTIFRKLKDEGSLSMVPDLLKAMGNNVYTNTSLDQTAALVNYARNIDPDSIKLYSIYGDMSENYTWRYCMIDQQRRMDILKQVYGIDAAPMPVDTQRYEHFLYDGGFKAIQYLNITKLLFEEIQKDHPENTMTKQQKQAYTDCWNGYSALQNKFNEVNNWVKTFWDDSVKETREEKAQLKSYFQTLTSLEKALQKSADKMKKTFGLKTETNWSRSVNQWYEKGSVINDVYVDFR